jgi:hypothetical protein
MNAKNEQGENQILSQIFNNTEGRLDSKHEHNLPAVNERDSK